MITKIKLIKNLGIFRDFNWDNEVQKSDGSVIELSHINILYGRNYSGKTTLSRLLRAVQTGVLSDKYGRPEFKLQVNNGNEINDSNFQSNKELVRVFNEDFVKENLKFITNPNESIESFALIGGDNIRIEKEIEALNNEIGSDEKGSETGLKAQFVNANHAYSTANTAYKKTYLTLEEQLKEKATGRENSIKYKLERYGEPNYTKTKLENDISSVLAIGYITPTIAQIKDCENLIEEKPKKPIPTLPSTVLTFGNLSSETQLLVIQKVGVADKIEELTKDAVLNRWVRDGKVHHKDKRENCAFCGNPITEERWAQLDKHFDEESAALEKDIDSLVLKINNEVEAVEKGFSIGHDLFYSKFYDRLDLLCADYIRFSKQYIDALKALVIQLQTRKSDIINPKEFEALTNYCEEIQGIWSSYETLRLESNTFTELLTEEQTKSKEALRLNEIENFISTIKYKEQINKIEELADELEIKKETME
ncbi:MAG: AAA family ATPase, partial [Spirochaetaceae bacterium]|nr:AAA family ATPase [Spirochaetaceae bacterium]